MWGSMQPKNPPKDYKSPRALINALKSGQYPKSWGQFYVSPLDVAEAEKEGTPLVVGYCCLGVYNEECHLGGQREQGLFGWRDSPYQGTRAHLPDGHWLLEKVVAFYEPDQDPNQFQGYLTVVNDNTDTWGPVIDALEKFDAGEREFL